MPQTADMVRLELFAGLLSLALCIYCVIDLVRRSDDEIPHLPKLGWLALVLLFPIVGGITWLVLRSRRPQGQRAQLFPEYERPGRAQGLTPESDAEFLRRVKERADEQRRRHREQQLREQKEREQGPAAEPENPRED